MNKTSKFYVIKHPTLGYLRTKYWRPLQWTDDVTKAKKWDRKCDVVQCMNKSVRFSDHYDESHVEEIEYVVTNIISPIKND